jgi:hypothetical protein
MNKIVVVVVGVSLAILAAYASAGSAEKAQLTACKAALEEIYGEHLRTRLINIRRRSDGTHMRMRVTPRDSSGEVIVCSQAKDGVLNLMDRDGIALAPVQSGEKVSLAD